MMLVVSQICDKYGVRPEDLGFTPDNPKVYFEMTIAANVFEVALDQKRSKKMASRGKSKRAKKPSWERDNPEAAKLLSWASKGAKMASTDPLAVQVQMPQR